MAKKKKRKKSGKKQKKWVGKKVILFLSVLFIAAPALFITLILTGFFGPVPSTDELALVRNYNASQIYSADGKRMGTYYLQNRTEVDVEQVNPVMTDALDRKSTRLNSSHVAISYAVFCLKKKKK